MKKALILVYFLNYALVLFSSECPLIKENSEVWINIFIHGIVKPPIRLGDGIKITEDKTENTEYYFTVSYLRGDQRIYYYQPIQQVGLVSIDLSKGKGSGASATANIYQTQYNLYNDPATQLYYTFGWSGLLSRSAREKEAQNLYNDLVNEQIRLKECGITPKIRILAYSHGGNLALNLAHKQCGDIPITIDELYLVGTPIHQETDCLINHPMFKKVYNFYSKGDFVQKLDFVTSKNLSSHRRFAPRKCCNGGILPDKLMQIQIRLTKVWQDYCKKITQLYHKDPGHIELWFFGWMPIFYNKKFGLYPLAYMSLFPSIMHAIKSMPELSNDIILDVNPEFGDIQITELKGCRKNIKHKLPFLSCSQIEELKQIAFNHRPSQEELCDYYEFVKQSIIYGAKQRARYSCCLPLMEEVHPLR